jgi:hypothetical protein
MIVLNNILKNIPQDFRSNWRTPNSQLMQARKYFLPKNASVRHTDFGTRRSIFGDVDILNPQSPESNAKKCSARRKTPFFSKIDRRKPNLPVKFREDE